MALDIFELPSDYITHLFTEWLQIRELGKLDVALTNYAMMFRFRKEISLKQFMHPGTFVNAHCFPSISGKYYSWIISREIKVKELTIKCILDSMELWKLFKVQKSMEELNIFEMNPTLELLLPKLVAECMNLKELFIMKHSNATLLRKMFTSLPRPSLLIQIEFYHIPIALSTISLIGSVCLLLNSLDINYCDIDDDYLEIESNLTCLTKLYLSAEYGISNDDFIWFIKSCRNLQLLCLIDCDITQVGVSALLKFTDLRCLMIDSCTTISCNDLEALISICPIEKLSIDLAGDYFNILQILHHKTNLSVLALTEQSIPIPIDSIRSLMASLTLMKCLLLDVIVDDSFLLHLVDSCPNLSCIALSCGVFSNDAILYLIRVCKGIRMLDIQSARYLDDNTLFQLALTGLTHLAIWSENLTVFGYGCFKMGFISLREVYLHYETKSVDETIITKLKQSRRGVKFSIGFPDFETRLFTYEFD